MIFLSKNYMYNQSLVQNQPSSLEKISNLDNIILKTVDTVVEIKSTLFLFKGIVTFLDNAINLQTLE